MLSYLVVIAAAAVGVILLIAAILAMVRWQGWWRWAMAIPLLLIVGATLTVFLAIAQDPTSHNLWPLELAFYFVIAGVGVALLYLLPWLFNRRLQPEA